MIRPDWTAKLFLLCVQLPKGKFGAQETINPCRILQTVSLVVAGDGREFSIVWVACPHLLRRLLCECFTGLVIEMILLTLPIFPLFFLSFSLFFFWKREKKNKYKHTEFHSPRFLMVSAPISIAILVRMMAPFAAAIAPTATIGATRF